VEDRERTTPQKVVGEVVDLVRAARGVDGAMMGGIGAQR
jgi:hypothetical protein